jgi:hypothetical protein
MSARLPDIFCQVTREIFPAPIFCDDISARVVYIALAKFVSGKRAAHG